MESASDIKGVVIRKKNPYGLTDAEIAAIRIFTANDYGHINPATANSAAWLQDNKKGFITSAAFDRSETTETDRMSEVPRCLGERLHQARDGGELRSVEHER